MSREIKFRAWDKKRQCWNYSVDAMELDADGVLCTSDDYAIMQYTGLKDKNGKEIYEGDLVKFEDSEYAVGVVWWQPSGAYFAIDWSKSTQPFLDVKVQHHLQIEVIGNIYENPELLAAPAPPKEESI